MLIFSIYFLLNRGGKRGGSGGDPPWYHHWAYHKRGLLWDLKQVKATVNMPFVNPRKAYRLHCIKFTCLKRFSKGRNHNCLCCFLMSIFSGYIWAPEIKTPFQQMWNVLVLSRIQNYNLPQVSNACITCINRSVHNASYIMRRLLSKVIFSCFLHNFYCLVIFLVSLLNDTISLSGKCPSLRGYCTPEPYFFEDFVYFHKK